MSKLPRKPINTRLDLLSVLASPNLLDAAQNVIGIVRMIDQYEQDYKNGIADQKLIENLYRLLKTGSISRSQFLKILEIVLTEDTSKTIDVEPIDQFTDFFSSLIK